MNDHFVGLLLKYQRNQQMDALSSLYIWYEHFLTMQVYFILQHKRNDRDVDLTQESITYLSNVTIFIFHAKNFPFLPPSFWLNLSPIFLFPWNFHASPDPLAPSSSSLFSYDRWTQGYIFSIYQFCLATRLGGTRQKKFMVHRNKVILIYWKWPTEYGSTLSSNLRGILTRKILSDPGFVFSFQQQVFFILRTKVR